MSDVDTMRWGDSQTLKIVNAAGEDVSFLSSQMLNAHWQRPCVWRLLVSVSGQFDAADAGTTFTVTVFLRVGVGQTNELIPILTINWTVGTTADTTVFFDIPAENMQMQFQVSDLANAPGGGVNPNDFVKVVALAAPRAEPGGISQIRDGLPGNDGIREPDRDGMARWPGGGFEDGELRYRGRGY